MAITADIEALSKTVLVSPQLLRIHVAQAFAISGQPCPWENNNAQRSRNPVAAKKTKLDRAVATDAELGAFFRTVLPGSDLLSWPGGPPHFAEVKITGEDQRATTNPDLWWIDFSGKHHNSMTAAQFLAVLASHEYWK